jgi:hypothetical protein
MKQIIFFKNKLVVEVPSYYEHSFESYYSLVLYYPKNKSFNIKFIVVDSNESSEQLVFYNNKKTENYFKKATEEKNYTVKNHKFEIDNKKLFITSFEIIFKNYYINIRVNTLEELEAESKNNMIKHIDEIILTINENNIL